MFDKALYDKICSLECTLDELKLFFEGIENREFDTDQPFDKYYKLDTIVAALEKFKSGEISCEFLRYWANVYNLILRGGFFVLELTNETETAQIENAKEEISSLLDSISFIDAPTEDQLDQYTEMLKFYDGLLIL